MSTFRLTLAAIVASLWLVVRPSPAHACSGLPPLSELRDLRPEVGAQDVPTNTRVFIRFSGRSSFQGYDVRIRPVGGEAIPATWSASTPYFTSRPSAELRPAAALEPFTTYELLDNGVTPCFSDACFGSDFHVIGSFTTGAGPDTTPPVFDPGPEATVILREHDVCEDEGCCGPYDVQRYDVRWQPATDANPIRYVVSRARFGDIVREDFGEGFRGALYCGPFADAGHGPPYIDVDAIESGEAIMVRAVDLAGNTSEARTFVVNVTCPVQAIGPVATQAVGCRIAGGARGRTGAVPSLWLAFLGLVPLRWRRGRPRLTRHVLHRAQPGTSVRDAAGDRGERPPDAAAPGAVDQEGR